MIYHSGIQKNFFYHTHTPESFQYKFHTPLSVCQDEYSGVQQNTDLRVCSREKRFCSFLKKSHFFFVSDINDR